MIVSEQDRSQQQERGTKRQATEACTRALLACEAHGSAVDSLEKHPLASSSLHASLKFDNDSDAAGNNARGWNDCMAFLHAYHDKRLHGKHCPSDRIKAALFDAMEYERCLSVGAELYRGAALNILQFKQIPKSTSAATAVQDQLIEQIASLTRNALAVRPIPASPVTQHPAVQRLAETFTQLQTSFQQHKTDQHAFSQLSLSVLALLEAEYSLDAGAPPVGSMGDDSEEHSGDGSNLEGSTEQTKGQSSDGLDDDTSQPPSDVLTVDSAEPDESDNHHALDDAASVSSTSGETASLGIEAGVSYRAYTTAHDEIIDAAKLELTQELSAYRKQLDAFISRHGSIV